MKRVFSIVMSTMLLTSVLVFSLNIQNVRASGPIYIRADGSIDPPRLTYPTKWKCLHPDKQHHV